MNKLKIYNIASTTLVSALALFGSTGNVFADSITSETTITGEVCNIPSINDESYVITFKAEDLDNGFITNAGATIDHTVDLEFDYSSLFPAGISPSCSDFYDITLTATSTGADSPGNVTFNSVTFNNGSDTKTITSSNSSAETTDTLTVTLDVGTSSSSTNYYSVPVTITAVIDAI